jgi:hypothetical protein
LKVWWADGNLWGSGLQPQHSKELLFLVGREDFVGWTLADGVTVRNPFNIIGNLLRRDCTVADEKLFKPGEHKKLRFY